MSFRKFIQSFYSQVVIHIITWLFFIFAPFLFFFDNFDKHHMYEMIGRYFLYILYFYINAFVIIPKLLKSQRIYLFLLTVVLAYFIIIFGTILNEYIFDLRSFRREGFVFHVAFRGFLSTLFVFGLSTSYKITNEWFNSERERKDAENQKLQAELNFLKAQINPHFLFNTLNNIYSLAFKKSDDTPTAIVKLAQLMRYMLYDSDAEKVVLEKEIDYINNYIDLQRLRLPANQTILFDVLGNVNGKYIEPLLLLPLVENIFKHGVFNDENFPILIKIEIDEKSLLFFAKNIFNPGNETVSENSGIGLSNLKRRLELLYSNQYILSIKKELNEFSVELKINLCK